MRVSIVKLLALGLSLICLTAISYGQNKIKLETQLISPLGYAENVNGNTIKVSYAVGEIMTLTGKLSNGQKVSQGLLQANIESDTMDTSTVDLDCAQIQNVITPYGSMGQNDTWKIRGLPQNTLNTLHIFDRWGTLVREYSPYQNDWGGTDRDNQPLPEGTYFYNLVVDNKMCKGAITILK